MSPEIVFPQIFYKSLHEFYTYCLVTNAHNQNYKILGFATARFLVYTLHTRYKITSDFIAILIQ